MMITPQDPERLHPPSYHRVPVDDEGQHSEVAPSAPPLRTSIEKPLIEEKTAGALDSPTENDESPVEEHSGPVYILGWTAMLRGWLLELWCIATSILCLIVLVALLERLDDQPIPRWPFGLTPNTVVALISTICRAAFIFPVMEGLSQLKWIYFQKDRPLSDFQIFDDASRGPWGSIRLVALTKFWLVGTIPAVVLVTALLTSTITQSVITYPIRLAPLQDVVNATTSRAVACCWERDVGSDLMTKGMGEITEGIFQGLNHPYSSPFEVDRPRCTTGECTWRPFTSLDICVKTWNVTSELTIERSPNLTRALLPNDAFLDVAVGPDVWPTMLNLTSGVASIALDEGSPIANNAIAIFFVIYGVGSYEDRVFGAMETVLYFCANHYNVSVTGNQPKREVLSSSTDITRMVGEVEGDDGDAYGLNPSYLPANGTKGSDENYWMFNLMAGLQLALNGAYGYMEDEMEWLVSTFAPSAPARFALALNHLVEWTREDAVVAADDVLLQEAMGNISSNVARSLSKVIYNSTYDIVGETLSEVTFVQVRWPWLSFIATQIGLSVVFLLIVMVQTRYSGLGIVKGSSLPALFALSAEDRAALEKGVGGRDHQRDFRMVENEGFGIVGRFGMAETGWALRRR